MRLGPDLLRAAAGPKPAWNGCGLSSVGTDGFLSTTCWAMMAGSPAHRRQCTRRLADRLGRILRRTSPQVPGRRHYADRTNQSRSLSRCGTITSAENV